MAERPKLHKIDAEMQRWCALLEEEISTWPNVTNRPMFGMSGYYRGATIFAAIPRTRAAGSAFSLLIKLPGATTSHVGSGRGPGAGWVTFDMDSEANVGEALKQIGKAYELAGKRTRRTPRRNRR